MSRSKRLGKLPRRAGWQPALPRQRRSRSACMTRKDALNCRMFLTHLSCTNCGLRHEWRQLQNLCTNCQKPLFPVYDLAAVGRALKREDLAAREKSLWRFREVLPLPMDAEPVTLGEGGTPLLRAKRFGKAVGRTNLGVKDEA